MDDEDNNREIYDEFIEILKEDDYDPNSQMAPEPLPLIMTYHEVETMAMHLMLQLQALERRGCSLLFWQASDILFVYQKYYLLANLTQLVPLQKNKAKAKTNDKAAAPEQLVLNYPALFPFPPAVCAPELLKMNALPFITNKSASYYSLALLCLAKLNLSLETLQGTKLYYFLERCLKAEPSERLLYNNL